MDIDSHVRFPTGAGIFVFAITFRLVLRRIQPPVESNMGALAPGMKRLVCELYPLHFHLVQTLRLHGNVLPPTGISMA
jgi:hypothetical protein